MTNGTGRAVLRGTVASVAGILAMDLYFKAIKRLRERAASTRQKQGQAEHEEEERNERREASQSGDEGQAGSPQGSGGEQESALDDISLVGHPRREGEPSTVAVGRILYERLRHAEPSRERGTQLGKLVHWGYGMAMGGVYGLLEPRVKERDLTAGLGYGAALWLFGDELAVPLLGLAAGPTAHPPRVHVEAFGAHLVYGLTTSAATKALRHVM